MRQCLRQRVKSNQASSIVGLQSYLQFQINILHLDTWTWNAVPLGGSGRRGRKVGRRPRSESPSGFDPQAIDVARWLNERSPLRNQA